VRYLNRRRKSLHDAFYAEGQANGTSIEVALQYTDGYAESVFALPIISTPWMAALI